MTMDNAPNSLEPTVFLRDLAHRIWQIPTHFGVDGGDVDALNDIAKTLAPKPADSQLAEVITKAVLFEDCGSTEDWEDNLNIGEAVLAALSQHQPPADAEREVTSFQKPYFDAGHDVDSLFNSKAGNKCKACGAYLIDLSEDLGFGDVTPCLASGAHREAGE